MLALSAIACRPGALRGGAAPEAGTPASPQAQTHTYTFVDESRGKRTVKTEVYLPATGNAPLPIVLFSHGLRGLPSDYRGLWSVWVDNGFAVVAPVYPMTSRGAPDIAAGDLPNQPADAVFALGEALKQADVRDRLDGTRVVAAGHSEGALTTYGLLTSCCRDSRVLGAMIMAGDAIAFERYTFNAPPMPVLFIHGDSDQVVPIALGRAAFARVPWPKGFMTLTGGAHVPPYVERGGPVGRASTDFLRWVLLKDTNALAALRRDANAAGASTLEDRF
jgi:pimeloyl-ACP methyl ester carboxylesterase